MLRKLFSAKAAAVTMIFLLLAAMTVQAGQLSERGLPKVRQGRPKAETQMEVLPESGSSATVPAYAHAVLGGEDVLLIASGTFNGEQESRWAIDAEIFSISDGIPAYLGCAASSGTAYPLGVKDGQLYTAGHHWIKKTTVEDGQLLVSESASEVFDAAGHVTYYHEVAGESEEVADGEYFAALFNEYMNAEYLSFQPFGKDAEAQQTESAAAAELQVRIPEAYQDLLVTEQPENSADGTLISVSEKESIETAKARGWEYDGAGWLFSIRKIPEEELHQLLCADMSGEEVFAKDAEGGYYLYCHPTDVRLVRENNDKMMEASEQWAELNQWAAGVPEELLEETDWLTPVSYGNSSPEICLFQVLYDPEVKYTVSTTEFGPLEPVGVDPAPYISRLTEHADFSVVNEEAPDGEYVVLYFPDQDIRLDFFSADENLLRMTWSDGRFEQFYRMTFEDPEVRATRVMQEWYDAIAEAAFAEEELPAPETVDLEQIETYESTAGWAVRYRPALIELKEFADGTDFIYTGTRGAEGKLNIRYIADQQPEEALGYLTDTWEQPEEIIRSEGFFPGTDDQWAYWREQPEAEDGSCPGRTAIAGEYNDGVLLFEFTTRMSGEDEEDILLSDMLSEILNSITFADFAPQKMFEYIPGLYTARSEDGSRYTLILRRNHTGSLRNGRYVPVIWGSFQLYNTEEPDQRWEYTVEGDQLYLDLDGEWLEFTCRKPSLPAVRHEGFGKFGKHAE